MTAYAKLIDTTLREGEQTPGVSLSLKQKKMILDGLAASGVSEVEIGLASPVGDGSVDLAAYCRSQHPGLKFSLWSRCRQDDIDHGSLMQPDIISLSIPASDLHIQQKLGKDRHWVEETLVRSVYQARQKNLKVSMGFEDATRACQDFLVRLAKLAVGSGASRIRIADTVGIASPMRIEKIVRALLAAVSECEVAVHAHNDFGMASANAITALECGAQWADGTILGLGERTGCARLEELMGYLQLARGYRCFDISKLKELAIDVARYAGREISATHPLLGEDIFACETGLHLNGLIINPETYEPFSPESVGVGRKLIFGSKIGRRALKYWARTNGETVHGESISDDHLRRFRSNSCIRCGNSFADWKLGTRHHCGTEREDAV